MNTTQWKEFLAGEDHTVEEWQKAQKSANNWGCCAVGSLLFDDPIDPTLKKNENCIKTLNKIVKSMISPDVDKLGMGFFRAIERKNLPYAKRLFNKIHKLEVQKAL